MLRLAHLSLLRRFLQWLLRSVYNKVFGMSIAPTAKFSLGVKFDLTNPRGVIVGEESYVAFGVAILTHDLTRGVRRRTKVGSRCFIGARSIILPGLTIGDGSIVAAGAVVTRDVPPNSIVAGNPAKVIQEGILVGPYGRFLDADATQRREELDFQ